MTIEMLNALINDLEGLRSLKEDKYYEALCLLRGALTHPNYNRVQFALANAVISGKEFMSIDAEGFITNIDRTKVIING